MILFFPNGELLSASFFWIICPFCYLRKVMTGAREWGHLREIGFKIQRLRWEDFKMKNQFWAGVLLLSREFSLACTNKCNIWSGGFVEERPNKATVVNTKKNVDGKGYGGGCGWACSCLWRLPLNKRSLVMLLCFREGHHKTGNCSVWGKFAKPWSFQVKMGNLNLARWTRGILFERIFLLTKTIPCHLRLSFLCFLPRKYIDLRGNLIFWLASSGKMRLAFLLIKSGCRLLCGYHS